MLDLLTDASRRVYGKLAPRACVHELLVLGLLLAVSITVALKAGATTTENCEIGRAHV